MNYAQSDLATIAPGAIAKQKEDIAYVTAWRARYPSIPNPIFVNDITPRNCSLGHVCLAYIRRHPDEYKGKDGTIKITLFTMPYNPSSKVDQGLKNSIETWNGRRVLPFGDIYHIQGSKGRRPDVKTASGIMAFLADQLNGRLLRDFDNQRWMVVVL